MKPLINIAIDGWSACGKGTLAKGLADKLGYLCIDTGAMYRAFTLAALREKVTPNDAEGIEKLIQSTRIGFSKNKENKFTILLNGQEVEDEIRQKEVNQHVSAFSAISKVRSFLVQQQQEIAHNKGVVMDGRDIGTVVLPQAELKIFMTASPEIRAERRFKEMVSKQQGITIQEITENLAHRDFVDSNREDSPLKQAEDAFILDNSYMTKEEQLSIALKWVEDKLKQQSI